jgi:hypothetical protein
MKRKTSPTDSRHLPASSKQKGTEWYSVRCVFLASWAPSYEERITLWRAESFARAIEAAESEATEYARTCELEYLGVAHAFRIDGKKLGNGAEVFSLFRDSELPPNRYISRFFETGQERQGLVRIDKGPAPRKRASTRRKPNYA